MDSAFTFRGLKGLWWEPDEYLDWPPLLADAGYTAFMLCYTFCPETSVHWRRPFHAAETAIVRQLIGTCEKHGLDLIVAINPCIGGQAWTPDRSAVPFHPTSGRAWFHRYWQARRPGERLTADLPINHDVAEDRETLFAKCREAQRMGVRWFALCLDDIEPGSAPRRFASLGAAHATLAAELHEALHATDPGARVLLAPTYYWTEGARAHPAYVADLTRLLPREIEVFWTGQQVRSHEITLDHADEAAALFGRRPVLWYNYASNDSFRFALQLPPGVPPAADLRGKIGGVLVNPMRQVSLTRLHALVMGEYLADPTAYRHEDAIKRACRALAGDAGGPWLERCVAVWADYPDPRSLPRSLRELDTSGLASLADTLQARTRAFDDAFSRLAAVFPDPALLAELEAGAHRLRLLADAIAWRASPRIRPGEEDLIRLRVELAIAASDEETGCDARAVIDSAAPGTFGSV